MSQKFDASLIAPPFKTIGANILYTKNKKKILKIDSLFNNSAREQDYDEEKNK